MKFLSNRASDAQGRSRRIPNGKVPSVCILEFDGDLTDWLVREGMAKPFRPWACFHTSMFAMELEASPVTPLLERELATTGWAVRSGKVWTTDAPYRETKVQLEKWAREGVLAVEMQAASLFAFGVARQACVASVAMVSNAVDHTGEQFDTGSQDDGLRILNGIARAARSFLATV